MFRALAMISTPVIGVGAVLDADDGDQVLGIVDAVEHPEGVAARGVQACELAPQRLADPTGSKPRAGETVVVSTAAGVVGPPRWPARRLDRRGPSGYFARGPGHEPGLAFLKRGFRLRRPRSPPSTRRRNAHHLLVDLESGDIHEHLCSTAVDASDLPALHAFVRGLRKDLDAVLAGLSMPYNNGSSGVRTPRSNS